MFVIDKKMFRAKAIIDCTAEKLIKAFDECEDITKLLISFGTDVHANVD